MSNQYLKLRRSSVPGKTPETGSIDFGEIALNTYDGLAFMKKSGSNGEEIVTLGAGGGGGNINTGSFATTGSNTFTGLQIITGSNGVLRYSGTDANTGNPGYPSLADIHAIDQGPWLERFYNDTFSTSDAVMAYFGWDDGRFVFHNESTQSIGIQVNSYDGTTGLLVYEDKVAFVNNIEVSGSANISGTLSQGFVVTASGQYSHAEGRYTVASGDYSHAEGNRTLASNTYAHAEGRYTTASRWQSHAEGNRTHAGGISSHAEGDRTIASGYAAHAEGFNTTASGDYSHAGGSVTKAIGDYSHAEGDYTQAVGNYSHAEGTETIALGQYSHAEGLNTIASASYQHVQGQWNATSSVPAAFIVGNGTDDSNRSNLIYAAGNEVQISGSIYLSSGSLQGTASYALNVLPTPFLKSRTKADATSSLQDYDSIFNPSDLLVQDTSVFYVDSTSYYYVLGDLTNSGSVVVDGTIKVGGILYNSGSITGTGSII